MTVYEPNFLPRIERISDSDWELADKVIFFFSPVIDRLGLRFGFSEEAVWQESMTLVPHVKLLRLLKRGWRMSRGFKQLAANLVVNRHEIKGYWYILGFAACNLRQESLDFRMDWWCFIIRGRGSGGVLGSVNAIGVNMQAGVGEKRSVCFFLSAALWTCAGAFACEWHHSAGRKEGVCVTASEGSAGGRGRCSAQRCKQFLKKKKKGINPALCDGYWSGSILPSHWE